MSLIKPLLSCSGMSKICIPIELFTRSASKSSYVHGMVRLPVTLIRFSLVNFSNHIGNVIYNFWLESNSVRMSPHQFLRHAAHELMIYSDTLDHLWLLLVGILASILRDSRDTDSHQNQGWAEVNIFVGFLFFFCEIMRLFSLFVANIFR